MLFFDFLLAEALPDGRAKMHETFEVHHVLDSGQTVPTLRLSKGPYVNDLLDASRPAGHDRDTVGEIDRFLDGMRDEQNRTGIDARKADQFLLHEDARLRV